MNFNRLAYIHKDKKDPGPEIKQVVKDAVEEMVEIVIDKVGCSADFIWTEEMFKEEPELTKTTCEIVRDVVADAARKAYKRKDSGQQGPENAFLKYARSETGHPKDYVEGLRTLAGAEAKKAIDAYQPKVSTWGEEPGEEPDLQATM